MLVLVVAYTVAWQFAAGQAERTERIIHWAVRYWWAVALVFPSVFGVGWFLGHYCPQPLDAGHPSRKRQCAFDIIYPLFSTIALFSLVLMILLVVVTSFHWNRQAIWATVMVFATWRLIEQLVVFLQTVVLPYHMSEDIVHSMTLHMVHYLQYVVAFATIFLFVHSYNGDRFLSGSPLQVRLPMEMCNNEEPECQLIIAGQVIQCRFVKPSVYELGSLPKFTDSPIRPLYFSLVTIATLGFGDIAPQTGLGQAVVMAEIICGLLAIAFGIQKIFVAVQGRR
jgi:hypothetical protein